MILLRNPIQDYEWAHGDLNPGSSPCKGDVITTGL